MLNHQKLKSFNSINGVLRNPDMITINLESEYYRSYESGLIDLPNVHNVFLHCPNLGHFNNIGVRDENTIIKQDLCFHHSVIWYLIQLLLPMVQ